jgi:hypothetical protein
MLAMAALALWLSQYASMTLADEKTQPRFVIDGTTRSCGEVFVGEELLQSFNVRNEGDATLELSDNAPSVTQVSSLERVLYRGGARLVADHALVATRRAAPS